MTSRALPLGPNPKAAPNPDDRAKGLQGPLAAVPTSQLQALSGLLSDKHIPGGVASTATPQGAWYSWWSSQPQDWSGHPLVLPEN